MPGSVILPAPLSIVRQNFIFDTCLTFNFFQPAPTEEWDRFFGINVNGVFFCYKFAGKQMIAQGRGGRIIGASSVMGKSGQ